MLKNIFGGIAGRIIIGVVILGAMSGYYALTQDKTEKDLKSDLPAVGKCYEITGVAPNAKTKEHACDDDAAAYRSIAIVGDGDEKSCDDFGSHVEFESSVSNKGVDVASSVCGVLNVEVGDCIDAASGDIADCSGASPSLMKIASFQKVKTEAEAQDEALAVKLCGEDVAFALPYTTDLEIACVVEVA